MHSNLRTLGLFAALTLLFVGIGYLLGGLYADEWVLGALFFLVVTTQSGLGFDGNNNVGANLVADTPFWLGRLTHYNRTIYLTDDGTTPPQANFMEWVDLDVQVENIMCSGCPTC